MSSTTPLLILQEQGNSLLIGTDATILYPTRQTKKTEFDQVMQEIRPVSLTLVRPADHKSGRSTEAELFRSYSSLQSVWITESGLMAAYAVNIGTGIVVEKQDDFFIVTFVSDYTSANVESTNIEDELGSCIWSGLAKVLKSSEKRRAFLDNILTVWPVNNEQIEAALKPFLGVSGVLPDVLPTTVKFRAFPEYLSESCKEAKLVDDSGIVLEGVKAMERCLGWCGAAITSKTIFTDARSYASRPIQ